MESSLEDKLVSEWRAVASIVLLYGVRMLGLFMVLPVLFVYGEDAYVGANMASLGLALGAYGLAQALLQIPLGLLSDIFGRKPVILAGLLVFALGSVIAATAESVTGLIVGRVLQGAGAIASALLALVADLVSERNRSKAMAAVGASIGLSFTLAIILGPYLASLWGLAGVFWAAFVLAVLGVFVLLVLVPTPSSLIAASSDIKAVPSMFRETLKLPELMRLNFGIFALHASLMALFVVVPQFLLASGVAKHTHGQVYLWVLFVSFVIAVPIMMSFEKRGRGREVFLLAVLGLSVVFVLLAQHSSLLVLIALMFLFFVAFNLLEAMLPSLVSKFAPKGNRGTAMGLYSTSQFVGAFFGGSAGGLMLLHWGSSLLLYACASLCALWLLVAINMARVSRLR